MDATISPDFSTFSPLNNVIWMLVFIAAMTGGDEFQAIKRPPFGSQI
ncbi:hypothetical protein [Yersinia enterocolitica]